MRVMWVGLCFLLMWAAPALASQPLPAEEVFKLSAQRVSAHEVKLVWEIAPGYYLYRDRFNFHCQSEVCGENSARTGVGREPVPTFPPAKQISDAEVGNYAVYEHQLMLPLQIPSDTAVVWVTYQGCSAAGFCYPPIVKVVHLNTADQTSLRITDNMEIAAAPQKSVGNQFEFFSSERNVWFVLASFLGLGLLLGFTPCVFPMIPILASIIVGHAHRVSKEKSFKLAVTYVLSSAVTYAAAGMAVGWAGSYVQAFFQEPWVLVAASIALVFLACSLFGFYELQLPAKLRNRLSHHHHRQQGGTYTGVIVMGCLATLIISPCVSAPLVGALGYISATGDMYLGGAALFLLGLGMGLPLLAILTLGSRYLPKAGRWMHAVRALCGGLLLIVAVSLLVRVFPQPVNWLFPSTQVNNPLVFQSIRNVKELDEALLKAKHEGKTVFLDFYADWCITCKKLEKHTFQHEQVLPLLKKMVLLRVDVTANNADDKALQRRLGVFAPPTMILFDAQGKELVEQRIVGDISPEELLKKLPK